MTLSRFSRPARRFSPLHRAAAAGAAAALLTLDPLAAQAVTRTHDGSGVGDFHGFAVAQLSDIDGDGTDDYAVGSSNRSYGNAVGHGGVTVYSGATGGILHIIPGDRAGMRFGWSVSRLGDVNGDGVPDLVVGAPYDDRGGFQAGLVTVISGADRQVIWRMAGDPGRPASSLARELGGSLLGWAVISIGDIDGDGCDEVVASGPSTSLPNVNPKVSVYSGRTGALIRGRGGNHGIGHSLCSLGDLDGDGWEDIAIGSPLSSAPGLTGAGFVFVVSTRSFLPQNPLTSLVTISGTGPNNGLGDAIAPFDDLDGDGRRDLLVASRENAGVPGGPYPRSLVEIRSGRDGSVLRRHTSTVPSDEFGGSLARVGDLNGDGVAEYAVGAPSRSNFDGFVQVFDGATGNVLFERAGGPRERLGYSVEGIGDIDGDGLPEMLVGAPLANSRAVDSGSAYVLRFAPAGSITGFGVPCSGPNGPAILSASGTAAPGSDLSLSCGLFVRQQLGSLVIGASNTQWSGGALPMRLSAFGAPSCWLNVDPVDALPTFANMPLGPLWQWRQTLRLPGGLQAFGLEFYVQYLSLDPGAPGGFVASNGLQVRVGG